MCSLILSSDSVPTPVGVLGAVDVFPHPLHLLSPLHRVTDSLRLLLPLQYHVCSVLSHIRLYNMTTCVT